MSDSTDGTVVVLGWDGLDPARVSEWDLATAFGREWRPISSIENPHIGAPHTKELWPTLISGLRPEEHGLRAATESGVEWSNPVIRLAATLASRTLPDGLRTHLGRIIRDAGASVTSSNSAGVAFDTVFDGRRGHPIGIPNYKVARDEYRGDADRTPRWRELSTKRPDGSIEPDVDWVEWDERLIAKCHRRLGYVRTAAQREYDVIWVWLSYLDTVGHAAPLAPDPGWARRHYQMAATLTRDLRTWLPESDTVLCVSDHGLQDGKHTTDAFLGADASLDGIESVTDVAGLVDELAPRREQTSPPPLKDPFKHEDSVSSSTSAEVRNHLENLGYV